MKVLFVDDSVTMIHAASDELEAAGFETEVATDGSEALECVARSRPDLIILDIEMPVMRGDEAAQRLRNDPATRDIPLIALTSRSPETLGPAVKLFDHVLTKPFGFVELIPRINELLKAKT